MRTLVPGLLFTLLDASSTYAQAVGSCDPALIGSPSCPHPWAGPTSADFNGDGLDFAGMTTRWRADYGAGTRTCQSEEIPASDTLDLNAVPALDRSVRPSWGATGQSWEVDESGWAGLDATPLTRSASTIADSANRGLDPSVTASLLAQTSTGCCDVPRPVACCKLTPVGEPLSSIGIPSGAGRLAGLSMLKGGA
jgi:hypothetical protein